MAILTKEDGVSWLLDELGNPLTDDLPGQGPATGNEFIIFTTIMSLLLMIFGGNNAPS